MKPVYLEFCGVNSFSERAEIDFTKLLEFGIFGIFGDTGAGKSTILDCINFALYGSVGRARAGSKADIINFAADRAYANFEFEIFYEGKWRTFRAEREIKRKNAVQAARVYEKKDGAYAALAEGVRDCDALLERIVGLEQRDFEKCIALPQGEFSQFVRSARSDRVKLVSRLFDLEKYGDELKSRVTARYNEASLELKTVSARMEPYLEATEARIKELLSEIKRLEKETAAATSALEKAREEERALNLLVERRRAREQAESKLKKLEEIGGEMQTLERELSRLSAANTVVRSIAEGRTLNARALAAQEALEKATRRKEQAEGAFSKLPAFDEGAAEERIAQLTAQRAAAESAGALRETRRARQAELDQNSEALKALEKRMVDPHFASEKARLDGELNALGQGDFLAFLETQGRSALLRGEYAEFAKELSALEKKHPTISPDTTPLIAKYAALSEGERATFADLKATFEARERAKEAAAKLLAELTEREHRFNLDRQKLEQLRGERARLEREIFDLDGKLKDVPELTAVKAELEKLLRERKEHAEKRQATEAERNAAALEFATAKAGAEAARQALEDARARYQEDLKAGGFESTSEATALVEKFGNAKDAAERLDAYKRELGAATARMKELEGDYSAATDVALEEKRGLLKAADEHNLERARALALVKSEHARTAEALEKRRTLEEQYAAIRARAELCERLKKLLEGNKFMEFVAEEYLQTVAGNASGRLLSLTGGRYFLRYDGGFFVGDNFNGGTLRAVYTLSGGETFLVSLSLALSLSAEICAKSLRPIEFFFLDEGFGTLDGRLVDTVMDSLEKLKGEHFSIGIISHVEALKNRIERKLSVKKATEQHGSQIISE